MFAPEIQQLLDEAYAAGEEAFKISQIWLGEHPDGQKISAQKSRGLITPAEAADKMLELALVNACKITNLENFENLCKIAEEKSELAFSMLPPVPEQYWASHVDGCVCDHCKNN